jgi:hypothetical protein
MKRWGAIVSLGALLAAAPGFAGDADRTPEVGTPPAVSVTPAKAKPRRQTTLERWRGPAPRAHADTVVRQEALDKALPVVTHTGQVGAAPHFGF